MNKKYIIIGDVHGRFDLLVKIIAKYPPGEYFYVFVGDLNDYGDIYREISSSVDCLQIGMAMMKLGFGVVVMSNHQDKLKRWLNGANVQPSHGLANTIEEINNYFDDFKIKLKDWLESLPLFYRFSENNKEYVVVHAYFDDWMLDKSEDDEYLKSKKKFDAFRSFCIYGMTKDGERVKFWEGDWIERHITKFHLISGHYHQTINQENFTMIDTDERSIVYYIPSENLVCEEKYVI